MMIRSHREQVEQDQKKLLSELVKNAKESIDTIAKRCGFSRQKTWRMMKQLESDNLIWGYTAVYDEQKLGKTHFMLMIKRTYETMDETTVDRIISTQTEKVANEMGISIETSAFVHGDFDWILSFIADDILQAKKFSEKLVALYPTGTESIKILRTMMFIRKQHILNPEREKLKEFL